MIEFRLRINLVTINRGIKELAAWESIFVSLDLITEGLETSFLTSIAYLLDKDANLRSIVNGAYNKVRLNGGLLILCNILLIKVRNLVDLTNFTDGAKEIIT